MLRLEEGVRLKALVAAAGLPVAPPPNLSNEMLKLMARDKKATDEGLRFVLLESLGRACLQSNIDESELASTLQAGTGLLEPV
jgi:3-dehydroquinate synthase